MNEKFKISVITICKNEEKRIEKTILSVLNQTYKNIEIIVMDGVSTDLTLKILEKYEDKIKLISKPDNGIYSAMNEAIKLTSGDFIYFFFFFDELFDAFVFERVSESLLANPNAKILYGNTQFYENNGKNSYISRVQDYKTIFLFDKINLNHQSIFYSKYLFDKHSGYDLSFKLLADMDFNVKMLVEYKYDAICLPIVIAKYELGGVSANFLIYQKEYKKIQKKYFFKYFFAHFLLYFCNFLMYFYLIFITLCFKNDFF